MKRLFLSAIVASLLAYLPAESQPPPEDMTRTNLTFEIHCTKTFERMQEVLLDYFEEHLILISHQSPFIYIAFFTNLDRSSSSVVLVRNSQENNETCIFSKGVSADGDSFIFPAL